MFDESRLRDVVADALARALAERSLAQPAPRPLSCTVKEAAALTGMSTWRIRQLVKDGVLPLLDLGEAREWIIPTQALEDLPWRRIGAEELDPGDDSVAVLTDDVGERPPERSPTAA